MQLKTLTAETLVSVLCTSLNIRQKNDAVSGTSEPSRGLQIWSEPCGLKEMTY